MNTVNKVNSFVIKKTAAMIFPYKNEPKYGWDNKLKPEKNKGRSKTYHPYPISMFHKILPRIILEH